MMVENVRRFQRHFPHLRAGGTQHRSGMLEQGASVAIGVLPGGGPAKADRRRPGIAIEAMRLLRQQYAAQQRHIFETAADDPERVEVVALQFDADPAELAKARLVADDAAERRRTDHRAAGL